MEEPAPQRTGFIGLGGDIPTSREKRVTVAIFASLHKEEKGVFQSQKNFLTLGKTGEKGESNGITELKRVPGAGGQSSELAAMDLNETQGKKRRVQE